MDKNTLMEMGLTEEQATQVMKGLEGNYVTKSRFNEVNAELNQAKSQVKERDTQLETLKKSAGDSEALQSKITELQSENKKATEEYQKQIAQVRKDAAVEKALLSVKAKNVTAVKALLDLENAELTEDGTVKGLDNMIKTLTEAEDSKFLFETQEKAQFQGVKPGEGRDKTPGESAKYQAQLQEARDKGNTLDAIRLKREASAEGITLI